MGASADLTTSAMGLMVGLGCHRTRKHRSQLLVRWQGVDMLTEGWAMCLHRGSPAGLMGMGFMENGVEGHSVALSPPPAGLTGEHG